MGHIIIISHRRSGTHLTIDTILNNFKKYKKFVTINKNEDIEKGNLKEIRNRKNNLIKTHSTDKCDKKVKKIINKHVEKNKAIYVVRNGLDVMVSLYKYIDSFDHPYSYDSFSEFLRSKNFTVDDGATWPEYWSYHVKYWLEKNNNTDNLKIVKFEDYVTNFDDLMKDMKEYIKSDTYWLQKNMHVDKRKKISQKILKKVLFWREEKSTSVQLRKGKTEQYKKYFSAGDVDYFFECAGEAMELLGYDRPEPK
jgi:hypothetical protein